MDTPYLGELLSLSTAMLWAIAVILFKKSGESVHPLALGLFKSSLSIVLLAGTMWALDLEIARHVDVREYLLLLLSGAIGIGLSDTLFFASLNRLGAGLSAIVGCLYAPSIILLSMVFIDESMTIGQLIGAGLILSAVLTITIRRSGLSINQGVLLSGIALGMLAVIFNAVGIVMIKPLLNRSPLLWVTGVRIVGGTIVLSLVLLFMKRGREHVRSLIQPRGRRYTLTGSIIGGYLAMILWLAGMKYTQASTAAALNQTSNIFIFIFAAVLLHEPITQRRVIGIVLGVGGAILVIL